MLKSAIIDRNKKLLSGEGKSCKKREGVFIMSDQDKRAVECMARCGIDFEGLCDSFPQFSRKDIEAIFVKIRKSIDAWSTPVPEIKANCS